MKKALFLALFLGILFSFAPSAKAQAYNPSSYGYGDAFSYYQYPIPLYTYFETPNSRAYNYYPSNYRPGGSTGFYPSSQQSYNPYGQNNGYGYNQYPQYQNPGMGYASNNGFTPSTNGNGARSSSPSSFYNPSQFYMTGSDRNTFAYVNF